VKYVVNTAADFLPAGGTVSTLRDIVTTKGCNGCHNPLKKHDGERREVRICLICHTPAATDTVTGNALDFPVMVHRYPPRQEPPQRHRRHALQLQGDKLED